MVYYSHLNEDPSPERFYLSEGVYKKLVCVAGSGERVLALLDYTMFSELSIIDVNEEALFLTELKLIALRELPVETYLYFIGFEENKQSIKNRRVDIFNSLENYISIECKTFWKGNLTVISKGELLTFGHFEKFLSRTTILLKLLFGSKAISKMLSNPYKVWAIQTKMMWQLLYFSFSLRLSYLLFGNRDAAFISGDSDVSLIPKAFMRSFRENTQHQSFFVHLLFHGNFKNIPNKFMPVNFTHDFLNQVKGRLQDEKLQINYIKSDFLAYLKAQEISDTFFSLSDISSFVNENYFIELMSELDKKSASNVAIVLRSFLRNQMEIHSGIFDVFSSTQDLSHLDMTHMYQVKGIKID